MEEHSDAAAEEPSHGKTLKTGCHTAGRDQTHVTPDEGCRSANRFQLFELFNYCINYFKILLCLLFY
jgi:hypothetical protein